MSFLPRRSNTRFGLRYSIRLKFISSGRTFRLDAITRNVSIGGLLLESPSRIPKACPVTFTITAERTQMIPPLVFAGKGEVVRIDPDPRGAGYLVALKYARPIRCRRADQAVSGKSLVKLD
jgi:PilZ domain